MLLNIISVYGSYKEIVSKLRIMNTIVWSLQGNGLKVAECEFHCIVVTRKWSQSCGIWIPLYGSYKKNVSKLRNRNTIVWQLPGNWLKVSEYKYHCMLITREYSHSCGIWIPLYGSYKESISKLRNINTLVWSLQGNRVKVADINTIVWSLQRDRLKLEEYQDHCMVVPRKTSQSCGI